MSFSVSLNRPWYRGVGSSSETPEKWDCALNGIGFMFDRKNDAFLNGMQTIPLIRQQADNADEPGESAINREDLWPRTQSSWHHGAGQMYLDAKDSDRQRFHESLGLNVWERGKLTLLNSTSSVFASANTNLKMTRCDSYVYVSDGTTVRFAQSPYVSWGNSTIHVAEAATSVLSIASDGSNVYAALGVNGIHKTAKGQSVSTHYSDLQAQLIAFVKGRLMAAKDNAIYNVTTSGAAPTAKLTHPNVDFRWVDFAEGPVAIYAAGYCGDKSAIYRTAVKPDGTELDVPVVAAELPDGEIVQAIQGYMNFLLIGTTTGLRLAMMQTDGSLLVGALIKLDRTVRTFEPQEHFVWFGWENFDGSHTGLGRVDLTSITDSASPAYASDIMYAGQGEVVSVITTAQNKRMFAVKGVGVMLETSTPVTTGWLTSGQMGYGIPDAKVGLRASMKNVALPVGASIIVEVSADQGGWVYVGANDVAGTTTTNGQLKVPETSAQLFETRVTLTNGAALERLSFLAYPASARGKTIIAALILAEDVETHVGGTESMNTKTRYEELEALVGSRRLTSYQELSATYSVFVERIVFQRISPTSDRTWWNGTAIVEMKVLGES